MTNALFTIVLLLGATDQVRVERLDGPPVVGALAEVRAEGIEVGVEDKVVTIPSGQLLRVWRLNSNSVEGKRTAPWVELRDGSILPVTDYQVENQTATFTLRGEVNPKTVSLPIGQVVAVRSQSPTPAIDGQWQELRTRAPTADVVVIRRKDAVDYVEGVLGNVNKEHVTFRMDGESINIPATKIDGLLYYRREPDAPKKPVCIVRTDHGMRLSAKRLVMDDNGLRVAAMSGLDVTLQLDRIVEIDYSAGKLLYLSDLRPRTVQSVPLIGFPASAELISTADGPFFDRGFFTPKPTLRLPLKQRHRTSWNIVSYERGIGMRSRTELAYRLPRDFRRFQALAGIDAELGDRGAVRLVITGDGKTLFDKVIEGGRAPRAIDLDIDGLRMFSILVDYGPNGDVGDRLYLCNPRIMK